MKSASTHDAVLTEIVDLIEVARRRAARMVNATMTAVYWSIGRRIVLEEQRGARRAEYGEELIEQLARRLTARFGRGFGRANLWQMRAFYLAYAEILQTASGESDRARGERILQTASGGSDLMASASARLPLPWSHYVKLLSLKNELARRFYEAEALRGGWTVRQLERQIQTQFYERTLLSRNKRAMLVKGEVQRAEDALTPEEEIKDPFVLEFLGLKDEYSENDLEDALLRDLESFLLELGGDFTFVGRQRRLRIGDSWFRINGQLPINIVMCRALRCGDAVHVTEAIVLAWLRTRWSTRSEKATMIAASILAGFLDFLVEAGRLPTNPIADLSESTGADPASGWSAPL